MPHSTARWQRWICGPPALGIPEPLALLRERVVSAIEGVPFLRRSLQALRSPSVRSRGIRCLVRGAARRQPGRLRGRARRGPRQPGLCRGAARAEADQRQHRRSLRALHRRARRVLPELAVPPAAFRCGRDLAAHPRVSLPGTFPARPPGARRRREAETVAKDGVAEDPHREVLLDPHRCPEVSRADVRRARGEDPGDADRLCQLDRQARRVDGGGEEAAPVGQADLDDVGDAHAGRT